MYVLDVGHGNAAVLHDEGGTVVFDTGKGAHVARHLAERKVKRIDAMLLSHADADHIGGAITLLMNPSVVISEVFLNADASKNSAVFRQLCFALAEANSRAGTSIDRRLATSTSIKRKGSSIEVLHTPDAVVLSGVGGKLSSNRRHTSNSLSAALRISWGKRASVLLGGDIEYDCIDAWKARGLSPSASVLVFPHHGGLPGSATESDAELFAFELVRLVSPAIVIFSNHRTKFQNPRDKVVSAIVKASPSVKCACTQFPDRMRADVKLARCWELHRSGKTIVEGNLKVEFGSKGVLVGFCPC